MIYSSLIHSSLAWPWDTDELAALTDDLQRHLNCGKLALLLLDLTVALNTVDYDLMTHHLTDTGVQGIAL